MNSFEMIPTEENLIEALNEDLLQRNKDLGYFYNLLLEQKMATSIAIDGRWGSGKTFFVKQSMLLINAKNSVSELEEEKRRDILACIPFPKEMEEGVENFELAVYYDAWENDNDTDPILSLVYQIIKQLGINYNFANNSNIFKLAGSILELFTGKNINGIIENLKSDNPMEKIKEKEEIHEKIEKFFEDILKERGERLVIFIDELDRCKPSYAIQLLERVKHYLCNDRITFVFSVNLEELQHSVKHYYGNDFDACRYLDRFFDIHISLPPVDKSRFYSKIGLNSTYILEKVCQKVIEVYNMELREVTRFYRQVRTAVYEPTHDSVRWEFCFPEQKGIQFLMIYIVQLLIGLKIVNISLYNEFVNGKCAKPLMDLYNNTELGKNMVKRLMDTNESYVSGVGKKIVTVEEKLQNLYDAIFVTEYTGENYNTTFGKYEFDSNSKNLVKSIESMLSKYADYQV